MEKEKKRSNRDTNEKIICKNCQHPFQGNYCSNCGQSVQDLNRPFSFVLYDFAGTIFAFDTRVLKSLRTLLFSPGKLSHDFIEGKRARYMAPFQMFVFVSFIFFLGLSVYTQKSINKVYDEAEIVDSNSQKDSLLSSTPIIKDTSELVLFINPDKEKRFTPGQMQNWIDNKLESDSTLDKEEIDVLSRTSKLLGDPNLYFATVFKYLSWEFFLLMPLFAVILLLFFNKKGYYFTAHLTFSINIHTFLFLTFMLALLIKIVFGTLPGILILILILQFFVYEYLALKRMYHQRTGTILFKLLLANAVYGLLFLAMAVTLFITAFLQF